MEISPDSSRHPIGREYAYRPNYASNLFVTSSIPVKLSRGYPRQSRTTWGVVVGRWTCIVPLLPVVEKFR